MRRPRPVRAALAHAAGMRAPRRRGPCRRGGTASLLLVALPPSPPQSAWSGAAPPRRSPPRPPRRSSAASPKGSHTARFHDAVTVHYRFHPLSGCRVACLGRRRARGQTILIVRHPDRTQLHLPEWMTRPDAALLEVRELPRISLRALSDLRDLIAPLLLARDETRTGERDEPKTSQGSSRRTVSSGTPVGPADRRATGGVDPASFDDPGGGNGKRGRGVKQPHDRGSQP